MNLHLFNTTYSQLIQDKAPMFIGISVNAKPMKENFTLSYLKWADQISAKSSPIQILIADEIAKYSYLAFSHSTKPGAYNRAIRDGNKHHEYLEKIINDNFEDSTRFNLIRWQDIMNEKYLHTFEIITREFESNNEFKKMVISIANAHLIKREGKFDAKKIKHICQYLLEELPTLLDGICINETEYRSILYPTYRLSGLSQIISDIQNYAICQDLNTKLNLKKVRMVEWIDCKKTLI